MGADPSRGGAALAVLRRQHLLDQMLRDEEDGSTYSKAGTGTDTVDGDDVVAIDNKDPENGDSTAASWSTTRITWSRSRRPTVRTRAPVIWSSTPTDVEAPAESDQVDLSNLAG